MQNVARQLSGLAATNPDLLLRAYQGNFVEP